MFGLVWLVAWLGWAGVRVVCVVSCVWTCSLMDWVYGWVGFFLGCLLGWTDLLAVMG